MGRQRYEPTRCIAVDVDGTLQINGRRNDVLIDWCRDRRLDGYSILLWSARGKEHARSVADAFACADVFDVILAKPGYIVDDLGWSWIKYTRVIDMGDLQNTDEKVLPGG
jgi:hypothetical protein